MYIGAYQKFEKTKSAIGNAFSNPEIMPPIDNAWIETTTSKAQSRLESVLAESKRQKDEGVKVSFFWELDLK